MAGVPLSRILGADPGARETGLILRSGDFLVGHEVVVRPPKEPLQDYIVRVLDGASGLVEPGIQVEILAVEGVNKPKTHIDGRKSFVGLQPLIDLSAVMGALIAWGKTWGLTVAVVPPDNNGQGPLVAYPRALVSPRTTKGTSDRLRHCRSAWDVSQGARRVLLRREMAR